MNGLNRVFDSNGLSLHLTDEEFLAFKKDEAALYLKYYKIERTARGIWASNKGRYIKTNEGLGEYDAHYMENLLKKETE